MPQVLEAPPIQDETRNAIAIHDGDSVAEPTCSPVTLIRSVMSVFTQPRPQSIPACADTTAQYESALDHICRTDPYLYTQAITG